MTTEELSSCPICKECPLAPRIYDCGHTVCEPCMIKNDVVDEDLSDLFNITSFKCPICRDKTLKAWFSRPINHSLLEILLRDEKYSKEYEEYLTKSIKTEKVEVPININLSYLCRKTRQDKLVKIYNDILPILFNAALKGKSHVKLTEEYTQDIKLIADLLAEKLFSLHNIYRMLYSSNECIIEFVPCDSTYCTYQFENEEYDDNNSNIISVRTI